MKKEIGIIELYYPPYGIIGSDSNRIQRIEVNLERLIRTVNQITKMINQKKDLE